MSASRPAAGFTLIEILVSVALLAVIGVLGYRGLDQINRASAMVIAEAETWQRLNGVFARLGHDLNQALSPALAPATRHAPTFWAQGTLREAGAPGHEFSFLRPATGGGDVQRVTYRFERPANRSTTDTGVWQLWIWPGRDASGEARRMLLLDGIDRLEVRLDGRNLETVRPLDMEVDVLPSPHGASLFTRGETQSLTTVTLGTPLDELLVESAAKSVDSKFYLHYNFPPFSTGEENDERRWPQGSWSW